MIDVLIDEACIRRLESNGPELVELPNAIVRIRYKKKSDQVDRPEGSRGAGCYVGVRA